MGERGGWGRESNKEGLIEGVREGRSRRKRGVKEGERGEEREKESKRKGNEREITGETDL